MTLPEAIRVLTIACIRIQLQKTGGNKTRAARDLGCSVRMIRMRCADTPELKQWRVRHDCSASGKRSQSK